ncbi:hypothetical protein [Aedoeadaptatus coxii]|uniref:hypothetical protein n=1 Tax=Aedoeadaptatus coxii TaxID=755172 RepID=UPI002AD5AAD8|nr:hypothetical protein [Peptoniphilus coxii]
MDRYLDRESTEEFIATHFRTKKDFVNAWGVSYSHFLKMMEGRGRCGVKSLEKLSDIANRFGEDLELFLESIPIVMKDLEVREIVIRDSNDCLIASINSNGDVCCEGYVVEYILQDELV